MVLRVYNSMTREKEEFKPIHGNRVNMFVCGPTVYDFSHIGHARTYVAYDIIARYLVRKGFSLFYLMNITDVDDKIINRAREQGMDPLSLARRYESEFYDDMKALHITSVNLYARASEYVEEIIAQIQQLIDKGVAYVVDGDVYYDVSTFSGYGELSHQRLDEIKKHRIDPDPRKKRPEDFALWKSQKPGELAWDSPWGKGRPGWHIEDTAITVTHFGPQYDLHGGAIELIFPHHEAEIAQAEAATGKHPLVRYWVHTGILNIEKQKMSKSIGNIIPIREAVKEYGAEVLRLFFALNHYRSPIDFDEMNVFQASEVLKKLRSVLKRLSTELSGASDEISATDEEYMKKLKPHVASFYKAMDDDFNTPEAMGVYLAFVQDMEAYLEKPKKTKKVLELASSIFREFISVFGFPSSGRPDAVPLPQQLVQQQLLRLRERYRKEQKWAESDSIRDILRVGGTELEDTPTGLRLKSLPVFERHAVQVDDRKYLFTREELEEMANRFSDKVRCEKGGCGREGATYEFTGQSLCIRHWYEAKHQGPGHKLKKQGNIISCICTLPK